MSPEELDRVEEQIDSWCARQAQDNPIVLSVERDVSDLRRWYVRVAGEDKPVYAVWLTLRQRTLHYETYFLPAPTQPAEQFYANLLRRNMGFYGLAFAIGAEDAVYLVGRLAAADVDDDQLDRVLGSVYAAVEQCFRAAIRLGLGVEL